MNRSIDRKPQTHSAQHSPALAVQCDSEPFAEQLELSCIHPQLVPMRRHGLGYLIHSSAHSWRQLPSERGFAGFGLMRGMRMLLDVLAGLRALHQTYLSSGVPFAHGEVAPLHFRIDPRGVCRLVPLTLRHSVSGGVAVPHAALGYLAPERLIGQPVGARADVFSIGVLLWEALACRRLFDERTTAAILERMRAEIEPPDVPAHFSWAAPLQTPLSYALKVNQTRRQIDCSQLAELIAGVARDRLPSHAELAAFSGRSGLPTASSSPPAPAAPIAAGPAGALADSPSKSAIFTRATVPGAHRMTCPVPRDAAKRGSAPLRFTTVRMSAVQLRQNGLFDADDPSAPQGSENTDRPQAASPPRSSPPPLPVVRVPKMLPLAIARREEAALQSVAPPASNAPSVSVSPARKPSQPPPLPVAAVGSARPGPIPARPRPPPPPRRSPPPPPLPAPSLRALGLGTREPVFAEPASLATAVFAESAALAKTVFAEPAALAQPVFAEPAALAQPVFAEPAALAQPVFGEPAALAEPAFASQSPHRSPLKLLGWSALAGLLIGVVIAGVFAKRTGERAGPPGADRPAARVAAADSPTAAPSVGVRPATTSSVSIESGPQAVHQASPPTPKPITRPPHSAALPSQPAARRAASSASRRMDYGI